MQQESKLKDNLRNMEEPFKSFYLSKMEGIRESIFNYFSKSPDDEYINLLTGYKGLYPRELSAIKKPLFESAERYLNSGAKWLRSVLMALTLEGYGIREEGYSKFYGMIEYIQDTTISIDDYIDFSELRRGILSTHEYYGYSEANISSPTMFMLAHKILFLNELNLPSETIRKLLEDFSVENLRAFLGVAQELVWSVNKVNNLKVETYYQQNIFRAGFITFRGPFLIAARIANLDKVETDKLLLLGEDLLLGYNHQGDLLNLIPTSENWGKKMGDDIYAGIRSLPVIFTLNNCSSKDGKRLLAILDSHTKDEKDYLEFVEILKKYGGFEFLEREKKRIIKNILANIERLSIRKREKEMLVNFTNFCIDGRVK